MAKDQDDSLSTDEKETAYKLCMRGDTRFVEYLVSRLNKKLGLGVGANPESSGEGGVLDVCSHLSACPVIIDVGANDGGYSRAITKRFGDQCVIHAFEPGDHAFSRLQQHFGDMSHIYLNHFAVGKECAQATLYMDSEGSEFASLTQRDITHVRIDHGAIAQSVDIVSLDQYCADKNISKIELLKIDVEGHELDVLKGADKMFEQHRIDLVQFEFGGCHIDTRVFFKDFYQFLSKHKFELFRLLPSGKLLSIPRYREMDEQFTISNYLAVHKGVNIAEQWPERVASTYF